MDNLEKIDILRERMNIGYGEAKQALEASDWDPVEALVRLEDAATNRKEKFLVRGNKLVDKIKELVKKGNVTKIKVKQDDKILVQIPVTAGVVGVLLAPQLALVAAAVTLVSRSTIEIENKNEDQDSCH